MKKIGFIGLGLMGKPMAKNLFKKGFQLIVYNRTPSKTEDFKKIGVPVASSPEELSKEVDVVITIVTDHEAVREVLMGPNGAFNGARPGTVFIDMSTILPRVSIELSEKAKEKGFHFLDAPVSGSTWAAEQGTLAIMVGGEKKIYEENLEVFKALGEKIIYMGPNGNGSYAKLINNIIGATFAAILGEGICFAEKVGLDVSALIEVLSSGAFKSPLIEFKGPKMMKADYSTQFSLNLMFKDLNYMVETAKEKNFPLFLGALTKEIYQAIKNKVNGDLDYAIIVEFFRSLIQ
ncbi:NAD(P)-dependent oxidoreductase [SCandidatus Aminicenantes bacterium Aminicenantia_JdfR_composite]|jgi:3-hydroxyisobutyrate dehydrogenase-like beta-hydroxyacid dehydrogenase|nr:NAD(P)-dependent oxidoreductase [SCandidatus Aminicenantes bacterium Aminicenantia_JdfR_composite]MCP2598647.1 NAD(P)-dependent oxidoreductase [Candidatus Aminicenantes bacterium AC-335-L06]